jgi:hypothetical protein
MIFWGNIFRIFSKNLQKLPIIFLKNSLYYFGNFFVKILSKIYHFQSFPNPFTNHFTIKNSGYKSFYTTFESPNVNEIILYSGHL